MCLFSTCFIIFLSLPVFLFFTISQSLFIFLYFCLISFIFLSCLLISFLHFSTELFSLRYSFILGSISQFLNFFFLFLFFLEHSRFIATGYLTLSSISNLYFSFQVSNCFLNFFSFISISHVMVSVCFVSVFLWGYSWTLMYLFHYDLLSYNDFVLDSIPPSPSHVCRW